ncbi:DgyrCDS10184 [Dimorphilus gyrociliatus]|uniref:DgyrCDS10184 n=1 Tax=Dimorphilus gyrociliatus TaxID=2664684 RepID=A0A7I8VZD4_9ANNE|nr:DgyrCDS10184 [Dimorphilus gyrociliatus]
MAFEPKLKPEESPFRFIDESAVNSRVASRAGSRDFLESDNDLIDENCKGSIGKGEKGRRHGRNISCRTAFYVLVVLLSSIIAGINAGLLAPALLDLSAQVNASVYDTSKVFIWRGGASILASVVFGLLLDCLHYPLVLAITLLIQGGSVIASGWWKNLLGMCALQGLAGFCNGGLCTGNIMLGLRLFGKKSKEMIQAVNVAFLFGLGIIPFIVEPFVSQISNKYNQETNSTKCPIKYFNISSNTSGISQPQESRIPYAFFITGLLTSLLFIPFSILFCLSEFQILRRKKGVIDKKPGERKDDSWNVYKAFSLFFISCLLALGGSFDYSFSALFMHVLVNHLCWDKELSTIVLGVYQMSKVIFNFFSIFAVRCIKPSKLVLIDFLIMLPSAGILTLALERWPFIPWLCSVLFAFGMSNLYSSLMSFEDTGLPKSGKVAGVYNIAVCTGMMIMPPIAALILADFGMFMFKLTYLAIVSLFFVFYLAVKIVLYFQNRKYRLIRTVKDANS